MNNTRLSRPTLLAYGCLGLPLAVMSYPMTMFLHPFYAGELGLSLAGISTVLLLSRVFDFISDPVMGWISDHTPGRFGRRRPYVVIGLPILLLATYKLFMPEPGAGLSYLLIWNTIMYLGMTIVFIPYNAWGAELSDSYIVRSQITATRQVFIILGMIGAAVTIWFYQEQLDRPSPGAVLGGLGLLLLVLFPAMAAIVLIFVREPKSYRSTDHARSWYRSVRSMLRIGPYRRIIYVGLAVVVGEASRQAVFVFFMEDVLEAAGGIGRAYVLYFLVGILAVPLWQLLARRYGKHRSLGIAMMNAAVCVVATAFLGPGDYGLFLLFFVIKGASFGAFAYLPPAIIADVVDIDTARSGQRRAAMFFALHGAIDKVALAIGIFLALQVLALAGYDAQSGATAAGIMTLRIEYAVLPTACFLLATCLVWNFPLTEARHGRLVEAIGRREVRQAHAAKEATKLHLNRVSASLQ